MNKHTVYYRSNNGTIVKTTLKDIGMGYVKDLTFSSYEEKGKEELRTEVEYQFLERAFIKAGYVKDEFKSIHIPCKERTDSHCSFIYDAIYTIIRERYWGLMMRIEPTMYDENKFANSSRFKSSKEWYQRQREVELNNRYSLSGDRYKKTTTKSWFIVRDDEDSSVGYLAPLLHTEGLKQLELKNEKLDWTDNLTIIERFYSQKLENSATKIFTMATGIDLELLNEESKNIKDGIYHKDVNDEMSFIETFNLLKQNEMMFNLFGCKKNIELIMRDWIDSIKKIRLHHSQFGGGFEIWQLRWLYKENESWHKNITIG